MSVFIAPLLVFANVYLYNYICRLSTYQESNRWSAVFHEYKDNNVKVRSIRLYYGRMATINLNFSEYYLAFWNVQNMWDKIYWNTNILTFLIDRKVNTFIILLFNLAVEHSDMTIFLQFWTDARNVLLCVLHFLLYKLHLW
jgi:cytochrome c oxidase assembly protein Cox11